MDREPTPQKQRQKRISSNRRANSVYTVHGTPSQGSTSSAPGAFRTRNRTAAPTIPSPATTQAKPPSMLLRPPSNGAPGSTGVLYEPDATRRSRSISNRDIHMQTNAQSKPMDQHGLKASSTRILRPFSSPAVHETKIVPPLTTVKLITPQMQFSTDLSIKLGNCLELENFTVIGVLGLESVGKSTILSLLVPENLREKDFFSTRTFEAVVLDRHETTGVDLAISMMGGFGHPMVLLDSQPLLSSSMLADLLERNTSQRFGALTPEQQVEVTSYQLAVFLCAICHYVVFVHDNLAYQVSAYDLLRKIEHKLTQCRLPSVSGNSQRHVAQLLYVANNMTESELLYRENELFSAHERALKAVWPHSLVRVPYHMSGYTEALNDDKSALHVASFVFPQRYSQISSCEGPKTDAQSSSALLTIGHQPGKDINKTKTLLHLSKYSSFDEIAEDFQRFVLSLPSSPSFTSQSAPISAITPFSKALPPHALSLREWLSNASRVFEALRKASCFTADYISSRDHH